MINTQRLWVKSKYQSGSCRIVKSMAPRSFLSVATQWKGKGEREPSAPSRAVGKAEAMSWSVWREASDIWQPRCSVIATAGEEGPPIANTKSESARQVPMALRTCKVSCTICKVWNMRSTSRRQPLRGGGARLSGVSRERLDRRDWARTNRNRGQGSAARSRT